MCVCMHVSRYVNVYLTCGACLNWGMGELYRMLIYKK